MHTHPADFIEDVRSASRSMVRALGFMGGDFAGTDLSPSAVHALIEIEQGMGQLSARDLAERLRLEKSSVSRMLRKLVDAGLVQECAAADDARVKWLAPTAQGRGQLASIHAFARAQVTGAMAQMPPQRYRVVLEGMRLYADALERSCDAGAGPAASRPAAPVTLHSGYRTGLIARITEMHALYYARQAEFGPRFEAVVAKGLADFCSRPGLHDAARPGRLWWAESQGRIVGSVAIDGEDLGPGIAHLRWFIVDDGVRGAGVGRRLLEAALAFVDERPAFQETQLWTFSGLHAARSLYEAHGFACVEERPGDQWGQRVLEQRFMRPRP